MLKNRTEQRTVEQLEQFINSLKKLGENDANDGICNVLQKYCMAWKKEKQDFLTARNIAIERLIKERKKNAQLLNAAGRLSDAARELVGGQGFTVGRYAPCDVHNISIVATTLLNAVDNYDETIMKQIQHKENLNRENLNGK